MTPAGNHWAARASRASEKGESKEPAAMKQPEARKARPVQISIQLPERTRSAWARVQIAAQIQRSGATPVGVCPVAEARPREPDHPQLADMEIEP